MDSGLQACTHPKCSLRKQRGRTSGSSGDPVRLDLRGKASNAATTKWALTLFRTSPTSGIRAHTHYTETGGCHGGLERRRGYRGPREEEEKRREEEEKRGRGRGGEGERRQERGGRWMRRRSQAGGRERSRTGRRRRGEKCQGRGRSVFWACGIKNPAFEPRELLKAGDVEANPGPARQIPPVAKVSCESCNKSLTRPGLKCTTAACERASHKKKSCSNATAGQLSDWKCSLHRIELSPCEWCSKEITTKQRPISCRTVGCPARCHTVRRCSGISRYVRDPIWRCEQHGGRMRPPRLVGEAVEIAPPCAGCNAALRKNSEGNLICITCESC